MARRPLEIVIQDPAYIVNAVQTRRAKTERIKTDLVTRTIKTFRDSHYREFQGLDNSSFTPRNGPIGRMDLEIVSDGYGFRVGCFLETDYIYTPQDVERLADDFPIEGVEMQGFDIHKVFRRPDHLRKDKNFLRRKVYQEGWHQLVLGFNMQRYKEVVHGQEVLGNPKGLLRRRERTTKSLLVPIPGNDKEAFDVIVNNIHYAARLLEVSADQIYQYNRGGDPLGEVHFAYLFDGFPGLIFMSSEGKNAQSYSIQKWKDRKVIAHFLDPDRGKYRIGEEPKPAAGTKTKPSAQDSKPTAKKPVSAQKHNPAKPVQDRRSAKAPEEPDRPYIETAKAEEPEPEQPEAIPNDRSIVTLDDVVGCQEAKREISRIMQYFENPKEFMKWGISQKAGVILHGPPGTGKTLLARAMAYEAKAEFLIYKSAQIRSEFTGVSTRQLSELLEKARSYERSILFFDEFDSLARDRRFSKEATHTTEADMVNTILTFLDGFERADNVYLIGATNYLDIIDEAISARLHPVLVPLPNSEERAELVRKRIEKHKKIAQINPFGDIDYALLGEESEGMSGRLLVGDGQGIFIDLLLRAKELTDDESTPYLITTEHWLEEINRRKPEPDEPEDDGSFKVTGFSPQS